MNLTESWVERWGRYSCEKEVNGGGMVRAAIVSDSKKIWWNDEGATGDSEKDLNVPFCSVSGWRWWWCVARMVVMMTGCCGGCRGGDDVDVGGVGGDVVVLAAVRWCGEAWWLPESGRRWPDKESIKEHVSCQIIVIELSYLLQLKACVLLISVKYTYPFMLKIAQINLKQTKNGNSPNSIEKQDGREVPSQSEYGTEDAPVVNKRGTVVCHEALSKTDNGVIVTDVNVDYMAYKNIAGFNEAEAFKEYPRGGGSTSDFEEEFDDDEVYFPNEEYASGMGGGFSLEEDDFDCYDGYEAQFASKAGLEQVLESGPWMIRKSLIILNKWCSSVSLKKGEVTKVLVWVKLYNVPVLAYSDDGLNLIATQVGKPVMLDAFTSSMCVESWCVSDEVTKAPSMAVNCTIEDYEEGFVEVKRTKRRIKGNGGAWKEDLECYFEGIYGSQCRMILTPQEQAFCDQYDIRLNSCGRK
ncbi:zinc knuckle CX2CX4HX4C containing protein [Tanacetum coccineum]